MCEAAGDFLSGCGQAVAKGLRLPLSESRREQTESYGIRSGSAEAAVPETTGFVSSDYIKFHYRNHFQTVILKIYEQPGISGELQAGHAELHAQYPQWTFTALQTNLDWNTVIENESVIGRNLVGRENISSGNPRQQALMTGTRGHGQDLTEAPGYRHRRISFDIIWTRETFK